VIADLEADFADAARTLREMLQSEVIEVVRLTDR
jgi:hypothetical protein